MVPLRSDALALGVRADRDGRVVGQFGDDLRHVLDQVLDVVRLVAERLVDVVEVVLGQAALLHEFFNVEAVRLRRGDPPARRVELRQIAELLQRSELVAHRRRADVRQVLFRNALAGYGDGGVDVLIHNDL